MEILWWTNILLWGSTEKPFLLQLRIMETIQPRYAPESFLDFNFYCNTWNTYQKIVTPEVLWGWEIFFLGWCVLTFLDGLHHKWVLKNGLYVEVIPVVWVKNWWWHLYSYLFGCVAHVHLILEHLLLQLLLFVRVTVKDILPWSSGVLSSEEGHCIVLVQGPQGS